ncbi:MAG: branched-chain amino acid ABC transporter permease [Pseudomonadota bacterium]
MAYLIFSASLLLIYVGLAQCLHVQFGMLGIPNFGVVGFWGLGMYGVGVLNVQLGVPFLIALILACALVAVVAYGLGRLILNLKGQDIVCATLAFSAMVALLVVTEKWMTEGVVGLGTIKYPFPLGKATEFFYFLLLVAVVVGLQYVINKLRESGLGRLMFAIRDNEELAASLGKDSVGTKQVLFVITCTLMALLGGLSAPLNQFLTPNMLVPGMTFAVWIGLILGGKENRLGALLGVFVTFGLFDILIETYVPVPPEYAMQVPNFKLFLYGAVLIAVLLFRPQGILSRNAKFGELLRRAGS